jgi:hypothetical protein
LGLKGAAVQDVGTVAGTVAAGNDARIVNAVQRGNNLSDLTDKSIARNNLGLGTAATAAVQISKDDTTAGRILVNGSAIAVRAVKALAGGTGNDVSDTNNLPSNSASFVYTTAVNSPGLTGTLLDVAGLNSSYNIQIAASYANAGNIIKFRTYNGDASRAWNPWYAFYHSGNKPTAVDVGALPAGGTAAASIKLATARTIAGVVFDGTANIAIPAGNVGAYTKAEGDNKYQPKGSYTPAGQAYTKAESDSRYASKGTSGITTTGNFSAYYRHANGLVFMQTIGGIAANANSDVTVTLPASFPNGILGVGASYYGTGGNDSDSYYTVQPIGKNQLKLHTRNCSGTFSFVVAGY